MKYIALEKEIEILQYLISEKKMDNGASRVVYELDKKFVNELELDPHRDYVIKVAMGIGGLNQTRNELDFFKENAKEYPLAEIVAEGVYVIIMEKVRLLSHYLRNYADFDEAEDFINWVFDADDNGVLSQQSIEDMNKVCDSNNIETSDVVDLYKRAYYVATELEDLNGRTNDNGQLGMTATGRIVAYDYGYPSGSGYDLCSDISDYIYDDEFVDRYFNSLCDILKEQQDVYDAVDRLECELTGRNCRDYEGSDSWHGSDYYTTQETFYQSENNLTNCN